MNSSFLANFSWAYWHTQKKPTQNYLFCPFHDKCHRKTPVESLWDYVRRAWMQLLFFSLFKVDFLHFHQHISPAMHARLNLKGVGHRVSTNVSWPANRSSSSEFSPLGREGALLASSLNRSAGSSLLRSGWETPRLTVAGGLWTHKWMIPHGHRASQSKASSVSWPFGRLWRAERKRLFGMTWAEKIHHFA